MADPCWRRSAISICCSWRPTNPIPVTLRVIEFMLYFMWDLGLKVGHATRSIAHCLADAEDDLTIRTSLIDARLLAGDAAVVRGVPERPSTRHGRSMAPAPSLPPSRPNATERHRRFGESAFLVEPNIKEGRGGLRDLQTLYWMIRAAFGQFTPDHGRARRSGRLHLLDAAGSCAGLRRSWDFLWTVRFHMHYVSGRAEDRLTFDLQPVVGARMGYTRHGRQDGVERFMRHYFLTARDVTRLTHVVEPAVIRETVGEPALQAEPDPRYCWKPVSCWQRAC